MEVASLFPGKRTFAPATHTSFFEPPSAKRFKCDPTLFHQHQSEPPAWTWPVSDNDDDSSNNSSKRGLEDLFSRATKRFRFAAEAVVSEEESSNADCSSSCCRMEEDLDLDEARSQLFESSEVMDRILGFMDSLQLENYRAVSKRWNDCCERALERRRVVLADPPRQQQLSWTGKEYPRLVFDTQFRVRDGADSLLPIMWSYDRCENLQLEISGLSWNSGSLGRSVNLMGPQSNNLVQLIARNLPCVHDGEYHNLKILVERGRVFLKLDNHWLPGTIPVKELAKLLGICNWKGLPWRLEEEEDWNIPETMEE